MVVGCNNFVESPIIDAKSVRFIFLSNQNHRGCKFRRGWLDDVVLEHLINLFSKDFFMNIGEFVRSLATWFISSCVNVVLNALEFPNVVFVCDEDVREIGNQLLQLSCLLCGKVKRIPVEAIKKWRGYLLFGLNVG